MRQLPLRTRCYSGACSSQVVKQIPRKVQEQKHRESERRSTEESIVKLRVGIGTDGIQGERRVPIRTTMYCTKDNQGFKVERGRPASPIPSVRHRDSRCKL